MRKALGEKNELVREFMFTFMRMEYALKLTGIGLH